MHNTRTSLFPPHALATTRPQAPATSVTPLHHRSVLGEWMCNRDAEELTYSGGLGEGKVSCPEKLRLIPTRVPACTTDEGTPCRCSPAHGPARCFPRRFPATGGIQHMIPLQQSTQISFTVKNGAPQSSVPEFDDSWYNPR